MPIVRMTDLDLTGKRVLIRQDLNVPIEGGRITSEQRITASLPTLKLALQFTARIVAGTDVLTQGAGALNIPGASLFAAAINTEAPHGMNWIRHRLTAANVDAFGQFIAWGQRIIYGDRFMQPRYAQLHLMRWDDDIVWAYDAIADNIVWGNSGDNIVWGNDDNIVWGNSQDDNIVWGNGEFHVEWKADTIEGFWWGK